MALYQADLIDEEVVTQWGTHVSKKYVDKETSKKVRKASEPFLKVCGSMSLCVSLALIYVYSRQWLEEADDDDGDGDDDE